jgi:RNA-binding protein YhbY
MDNMNEQLVEAVERYLKAHDQFKIPQRQQALADMRRLVRPIKKTTQSSAQPITTKVA